MQRIRNYEGSYVRLTEERLPHMLEHPEMRGLEGAISESIITPETVVESTNDPHVKLYYRLYIGRALVRSTCVWSLRRLPKVRIGPVRALPGPRYDTASQEGKRHGRCRVG